MWPVLNCYVGDTHHYISLTLDETYFRSLEDWAVSASMILCSHTNDIRLYAYPLQRDTRPSVRSYTNINQIRHHFVIIAKLTTKYTILAAKC